MIHCRSLPSDFVHEDARGDDELNRLQISSLKMKVQMVQPCNEPKVKPFRNGSDASLLCHKGA
jgi:hypothetical protein